MGATWGNNIELTLFGESHGDAIGIVIGKLPAGIYIDLDAINKEMKRRAPGHHLTSSMRKESDEVHIISGILDGYTTGAPLCAVIKNEDHHSKDYSLLKDIMRPSHSDYPAYIKYDGFNDVRGGGHFSGRLTAPLVFAGSIAKSILKQKGIVIGGHILSIYDQYDDSFDTLVNEEVLASLSLDFPTLNKNVAKAMQDIIMKVKMNKDSVGGQIECCALNVPVGLGDPFFDSLESHISSLLFSIPAVKSVSFGDSHISSLYGHEANDCYYYDQDIVKAKSNHNGGIVGGLSNGMPLIVTVGIKPTPSISLKQDTINVKTKQNVELELTGRHDPCIVPRAVVVVEAMLALAILDMML